MSVHRGGAAGYPPLRATRSTGGPVAAESPLTTGSCHPGVDVDDLTQVFLYAYAYRDPEAVDTPPRALLIHPSETPGEPGVTPIQVKSVAERVVDAELTIVALHIPTVLDEASAGGGPSLHRLRNLCLGKLPVASVTPPDGLVLGEVVESTAVDGWSTEAVACLATRARTPVAARLHAV
jgi:hypothetical protein